MQPKLEIEYLRGQHSSIWIDASNAHFAGCIEGQAHDDALKKLVNDLRHFPASNDAEVYFEIGEQTSLASFCSIRFFCLDTIDTLASEITLANQDAPSDPSDSVSMVTLSLQFQPVSLSAFVSSLQHALDEGRGIALLQGVYPDNER